MSFAKEDIGWRRPVIVVVGHPNNQKSSINMHTMTISDIYENTETLSNANQWTATKESQLKHLAEEVMELAISEPNNQCEEAFDVIWNVLNYLRIQGHSVDDIQTAFTKKITVNATRKWRL